MITKEDNEDFKNSIISWICDNDNFDNDVIVRDYCHIIGTYWVSANINCNINLKLNQSQNSYCSQPKKLCFSSYYAWTS